MSDLALPSRRCRNADLPVKTCAVCARPFHWRRKWARDWAAVRFCSERCRRTAQGRPKGQPPCAPPDPLGAGPSSSSGR
ncbi:MAG: DUF2256 domain-containing protein [Rhodospirillales bacterium]|nr:MAG: DUF2256 domain-containing protein [Rhodospirillales bacterium]